MTKKRVLSIGMIVLALLVLTTPTLAQAGDSDGDGVSNRLDRCPTVPGPASNNGCPLPDDGGIPDKDGDGVADYVDQCPDQAGTGFTEGCPVEAPSEAPVVAQPAIPQVVMVWESTDECMVGVPLTSGTSVNIREQPTTSSAIIGQLAPGQQFAPFFRDYDENNAIWFGGAPAGDDWGWVKRSVVIDNGQCVNLPMIIHVDAPGGTGDLILTLNINGLDDPTADDLTPEPLSTNDWDLLSWQGSRVLVITDGGAPMARHSCHFCDFVITHGIDKSSPILEGGDGGNPPATSPPPTSAPAAPAKPMPVLLVIADINDADCTAVSGDYCLLMLLQLPAMGDAPGQCPPTGDNARRLPKLLEYAAKGKVFKKVEIHGTARSAPPTPELTLDLDDNGRVTPAGVDDSNTNWDYACSLVGFVPNGESETMGDGSVRIGVETFVILLPAVHGG